MVALISFSSIFIPFFMGLTLLVFLRGEDRHMQLILSSVALAFSLLMIVITIMMHAPPATLCISWLASAGPMCVTFEPSSLVLVFLTVFPLFYCIISQSNKSSIATQSGLVLIAYSAMLVALISDHFMLRYVSLEFVGLCITAVALLLTVPAEKRWTHTKQVFLNLRVGDLALLIAIFLMFTISRSFNITDNFNNALNSEYHFQVIISTGLLMAVWVKMAIWPFNRWRLATKSIKSGVTLWLLDIVAPVLGLYLLYRSNPLLGLHQKGIFPAVLIVAYLAVLVEVIQNSKNINNNNQQILGVYFTLIIFVLSAFWIPQKDLWVFMLLWIILRVALLLYEQISSSKRSNAYQGTDGGLVRFLMIHGFSFLILSHMSIKDFLPVVIAIVSWSLWVFYAIYSTKNLIRNMRFSLLKMRRNATADLLKTIMRQTIPGMIIFFLAIILTNIIADLVKGDGYRILEFGGDLSMLPFFSPVFWMAMVFGSLAFFAVQRILAIEKQFRVLKQQLDVFKKSVKIPYDHDFSDPLDFSEKFNAFFQKISGFIYQVFEKEGAEKISNVFERFFEYIFRIVEGFASGDLWNRMLEVVVNSSQKMKQMHHGLLRFNLLWLLVFVISISLVVWFGYVNGGV